jgi:hypothetical protein
MGLQCQRMLIYEAAMQIITETELLERITAFRERHDHMAPTTFGRKATGNANLVRELEEGKSPSLRTAQRIAHFMDQADREAGLPANPPPPLTLTVQEEEEVPLPFGTAPADRAGASLPISSTIPARPPSASSGSCSETDRQEKTK